jgi:hypothetical protein
MKYPGRTLRNWCIQFISKGWGSQLYQLTSLSYLSDISFSCMSYEFPIIPMGASAFGRLFAMEEECSRPSIISLIHGKEGKRPLQSTSHVHRTVQGSTLSIAYLYTFIMHLDKVQNSAGSVLFSFSLSLAATTLTVFLHCIE